MQKVAKEMLVAIEKGYVVYAPLSADTLAAFQKTNFKESGLLVQMLWHREMSLAAELQRNMARKQQACVDLSLVRFRKRYSRQADMQVAASV